MDGALVPWHEANVHVLTHTLHYGYGVFEGIRCYRTKDGKSAIFRLPEHVARLFNSAKILGIDVPFSPEDITQAIIEVVQINKLEECYIRPLIFLGDNKMGLNPDGVNVRVAIAAWPWGTYLGDDGLNKGIRVRTSSFTRHHVNISMTKAKACGYYINSIFAKAEAVRDGYDEAILLDPNGYVSEGSGENIFILYKNTLMTPSLASSCLDGITRDAVFDICEELPYRHSRRDHTGPRDRQSHHRQRRQRRHHRPHPESLLRYRRRQIPKIQILAHRSLTNSLTIEYSAR
jgi:branched-chain amino acid aminotransferase